MSVLDMLYSQYGDGQMGSNQQETLQKLDALQQWQNPMMQQPQQQKRSYGPWDAIGQIVAAYARNQRQSQQQPMQPQMQQMPQPAPQMDVGNGVSSVLENLMQSHGSDSLFRGW